jgi:hypothetical protein
MDVLSENGRSNILRLVNPISTLSNIYPFDSPSPEFATAGEYDELTVSESFGTLGISATKRNPRNRFTFSVRSDEADFSSKSHCSTALGILLQYANKAGTELLIGSKELGTLKQYATNLPSPQHRFPAPLPIPSADRIIPPKSPLRIELLLQRFQPG